VTVLEHAGDGAALGALLMEAGQSPQRVYLIDAVRTGGAPGTVLRRDCRRGSLGGLGLVSSHGFGVAQAVGLAQALGGLPARLVLYGIEAADFAPGTPPCAPVRGGVARVVELLLEELACTNTASPGT
jgi:hydrogenase maturation protease